MTDTTNTNLFFYQSGRLNIQVYRQAVRDLLYSRNYDRFLTISPRPGFHDALYHEALNRLVVFINQLVYGKRYCNRNSFMKGYVIRERRCDGTPHFHILIDDLDGDLLNLKLPFRECCEKAISKIYGNPMYTSENKILIRRGSRLIGENSWNLQQYYESEEKHRLENYLLKDIDDPSVSINDKISCWGVLAEREAIFNHCINIPKVSNQFG